MAAALLCTVVSAFAQPLVTVSDALDVRKDDDYALIGSFPDSSTLVLYIRESGFVLQGLDADLKLAWAKPLELEDRDLKFLGAYPSKDSFTLVYSFQKKGETFIHGTRISSNGGRDSSFLMTKIPDRVKVRAKNFTISDNKRNLVFWRLKDDNDLNVSCYDIVSHKMLWSMSLVGSFRENSEEFLEGHADNDGRGWLVFEKNNDRSRKENSAFRVVRCDLTGAWEYKIPMEGNLWCGALFEVDNLNKRLVGAGLYSPNSNSNAIGMFSLSAPLPECDQYALRLEPFGAEFTTKLTGKKHRGKKPDQVSDMEVRELVLRRDGGLLLVAERYKQYVRRATPVNTGFSRGDFVDSQTDYYYDDLLVASVNPDGTLLWKDVLYKRQTSRDDEGFFSSYFLLKTKQSLRFLYNDDIRASTNANEYALTGKGESERHSIYETTKDNLMLSFRNGLQVSANAVIVPSERRNEVKLVRFAF